MAEGGGIVQGSRATAAQSIASRSTASGEALLVSIAEIISGLVFDVTLTTADEVTAYLALNKTLKTVTGTVSVDTDIVAAVASKRIKVYAYSLISASTTSNTITFQDNGVTPIWTVPLQAPAASSMFGANLAVSPPGFLFATTAGLKLRLDVSAAVNVTYSVAYWDADAP